MLVYFLCIFPLSQESCIGLDGKSISDTNRIAGAGSHDTEIRMDLIPHKDQCVAMKSDFTEIK